MSLYVCTYVCMYRMCWSCILAVEPGPHPLTKKSWTRAWGPPSIHPLNIVHWLIKEIGIVWTKCQLLMHTFNNLIINGVIMLITGNSHMIHYGICRWLLCWLWGRASCYLSYRRAANDQTSLRLQAISSEPLLPSNIEYRIVWIYASSLAPFFTFKYVLWQTVKTQKKCRMMRHFMRVHTAS